MAESTVILNNEQIEHCNREGYLVIDAITILEEVERLRKIYDQLFADRVGWAQGDQPTRSALMERIVQPCSNSGGQVNTHANFWTPSTGRMPR